MKPMSTMNVIPFIDVMLVLLAVVLTTATFVAQGKIPVSLPQAAQAEPLAAAPALELTIDAEGTLFIAEVMSSLEQLASRLEPRDRSAPVSLRVDAATAFRHFVAVVDLLKAEGFENLSIVTERVDQ